MKITLVADCYGEENNGTSITARRLVENMKARGHEVKVISPYAVESEEYIRMPVRTYPAFTNYIEQKNGVKFAEVDEQKLREGLKGSDVVHCMMPFRLGKAGARLAREMKIPYTSAFHVQPENITSHVFMKDFKPANNYFYRWFNKKFYCNMQFIHCPSQFIADQLTKHRYTGNKVVISNGVIPVFEKQESEKPEEFKDRICILFTGRYSKEKRHDLLIKAVKKSKYGDRIQLIFAGNGPRRKKIIKTGKKLKHPPFLNLFTKEELCKTINYCDLYVHPSDVEIEAISCIEAFTCGLVPIISDSKKTATKQFALSGKNLFKRGNPKDLAKKIDYFIEHTEEKKALGDEYIKYAKQFSIKNCTDKMEKLFYDAIDYYKEYYSKDEK